MTKMNKILIISFFAPFIAFVAYDLMEQYLPVTACGANLIDVDWLRGIYFGAAGVSLSILLFTLKGAQPADLMAVLLCGGLVWMNAETNNQLESGTILDHVISSIGYSIARAFPYEPNDEPIPKGLMGAIPPYTRVEAETNDGRITITTGAGSLRCYSWDGVTRCIDLRPADKEYQSTNQGLYYRVPNGAIGYVWENHNGITRPAVFEDVVNVQSLKEALEWINERTMDGAKSTYTSDGLVVGWSTKAEGATLYVSVDQILINGKKPDHLPGARDSKISVTRIRRDDISKQLQAGHQ